MVEKSEPGAFDLFVAMVSANHPGLTVSRGWIDDKSDNEEENKQEIITDVFMDQLISQVNIPESPITPTETTAAVTEQVQAGLSLAIFWDEVSGLSL